MNIEITKHKNLLYCAPQSAEIVGKNLVSETLKNNSFIAYGLPSGTYTFSYKSTSTGGAVNVLNDSGSTLIRIDNASISGNSGTFTLTSEDDIKINAYGNATTFYDVQIEKGSSATSYVPYIKTTQLSGKIAEIKEYLVEQGYDEDVLGYGIDKDNCNYIDFVNRKAVIKYARVDLGSLSWYSSSLATGYYGFITTNVISNLKTGISSVKGNLLSSRYTSASGNDLYGGKIDDSISLWSTQQRVCIRDDSYTDVDAFVSSLSGQYLVYECIETEIDLSTILGEDEEFIPVESGGTITFENENKANVPYSVTYEYKNA